MGAIAVISAYSCRINNYNISSGDKMVYFAANVSTPDLSPLQCRYKYDKGLTSSQIGRFSAQGQVVKVNQEVMSLKIMRKRVTIEEMCT